MEAMVSQTGTQAFAALPYLEIVTYCLDLHFSHIDVGSRDGEQWSNIPRTGQRCTAVSPRMEAAVGNE
jgi:hypothetical protein